jgi:hypothetical protein
MPAGLSSGNANYTAISTVGTTTLNQGPPTSGGYMAANPPAAYPVLYGVDTIAAGTSYVYTLCDIVPPTGIAGSTATVTNTLQIGTASAGLKDPAGLSGVGVRYKGALVCITTGTAGLINVLTD